MRFTGFFISCMDKGSATASDHIRENAVSDNTIRLRIEAQGNYPSQCFSQRRHGHGKKSQNLRKMPPRAASNTNHDRSTMTLALAYTKKRFLEPVPTWGEPAFEAWDVNPGRQLDIYIYIYIYMYI